MEEKKEKPKKLNKENNSQKAENKKMIKTNEDRINNEHNEHLHTNENKKIDQICPKLEKHLKRKNQNQNEILNESDFGRRYSKKDKIINLKDLNLINQENKKKQKKSGKSASAEKKKDDQNKNNINNNSNNKDNNNINKNITNNNINSSNRANNIEKQKKVNKKQENKVKNELPKDKIQPVEIIFNFSHIETIVQTNMDEIMENVINKFFEKSGVGRKNKLFLYDGIVNKKLSVKKIAKIDDIMRKKLNILVCDNSDISIIESNAELSSKELICPDCYENIILTLDNYKVSYKCKNYYLDKKHYKNHMNLDQFEDLRKIDLSKIKCGQCNKSKKEIYENQFYFCYKCKMNLCPLCQSCHDISHKTINYNDKNYKCEKHNENFIQYCENCNQNLCFQCHNEHMSHKIINLEIIEKDKIKIELENTGKIINEVKSFVEDLKNKLNNVTKNLENFYNIAKNFVDNYKVENRNYYILQNLKEIRNFNTNLLIELKSICNEESFFKKFEQIMDIYNKINTKIEEKEYQNEGIYIGEMKNNLRNGKGKMSYSNDDKYNRYLYEGEWKDDKFDGYGVMYWKNSDFYKGEWKKGLKEGKGIYNFCNGDTYEGDFKNDKKEGKGIYTYNKSNIYEGEMKNDYIEGKGIFYWENGDKYVGEFKQGRAEGKGVQFHVNGEMEMGFFSNAKLVGKYASINSDNKIKLKNA